MIHKITIVKNDGKRQTLKDDDDCDLFGLIRAVEKCEIKSFTVSLAPIGKVKKNAKQK